MRISFVMLNKHDIISLIENRLDSVSAEYQSVDNRIEIYRLDGDLIILEINQDIFSILYKENKYDFEIIYDIDDEYEISSSGIFSYEIIVRKNIGTQNESGTLIINSKYSKCKGINRGNNYVLNYSFTDVKYYDGSTGRELLIDINGKVSVYSLSVCHLGC
mgnify:CR=1 FL=1